MSDSYDKAEYERALRKEWAERAGLGFELGTNLLVASGGFAKLAIPNVEGSSTPSDGSFTGLVDLTFPSSTKIPLSAVLAPNRDNAGTYTAVDANSGRGTAMLPSAFFGRLDPVPAVFYLLGPNQLVLIGAEQGLNSGVSFFSPR